MDLKERNQNIAKMFEAIKDIADYYLSLNYPDPDQFMEQIEAKLDEYKELLQPLQPGWAISEISRLLEEHGYEHRESKSSLPEEKKHHFIMDTILITMTVNGNVDEETLDSIRNGIKQ